MEDSLIKAFGEMFAYQQKRPAIVSAGTQALNRLVSEAQKYTGNSGVVARFLIGLYDGDTYPFDLTELRRLEIDLFDDCLLVLAMDY